VRSGSGGDLPDLPRRSTYARPRSARIRPARSLSARLISASGLRIAVALVALAILAVSLIGGCAAEPSAEPTVRSFLLAWEQGRYWDAASYTTGSRSVVASALRAEYQQLNAAALFLNMGTISVKGDRADADFSASVDLGQDGAPWQYQGRFGLRRTGTDWKIDWRPSVINPSLQRGLRFAVVTLVPDRALILDSAGHSLLRRSAAYTLGVQPDRLADPAATAADFASVTGLDAGQILGQILTAPPNRFQELLVLNPAAYGRVRRRLSPIKGLGVHLVQRRLFTSEASGIVGSVGTENAELLHQEGLPYQPGATIGRSGLQAAYQQRLVGTPTREVVTEDARGNVVSVLKKWPGLSPEPVKTTIDAQIQSAAAQAAATAPGAAAIVAIQASTGRILAVSHRAASGESLSTADVLNGRYPPGDSFTIVSTAALLSTGFGVDTQIPCSGATDVGGQTFTNDQPELGIGAQPPFRVDFAHTCGTAFAGLSRLLTAGQLTAAASRFGLGARWQLPLAAYAGSVPAPGSDAERAADTIGQGGVRVSPLAMALVAAEVDAGTWHRPILVTDPKDPANVPVVPFSPQVMGTLRSLMRDTVASGAARAANLRGEPVFGQVGAAPLTTQNVRTWVNWFVGFRGDVAIAVLTFGNPHTAVATPVAARFLRGLAGH
jgi:cell division protein FtsI/penicillin-binding protein 2